MRNDVMALKPIYLMVKRCIYAWSGSTDDTSHIISATSNVDYMISTSIDIEPDVNATQHDDATVIEKFSPNIILKFKQRGTEQNASISIDFDLYKMLKKVANGYRPSAQDNNHFAGFVSFVKKLVYGNKQDITILHYRHDEVKKYQLEHNAFGYEFREV